MKKQILINIFSNYVVSFLQMLLGFLVVPFMIHKLGSSAFGLIVLAESTIAFFDIVTTSIRIALSRYVTFAVSRENQDEFREYLSSGLYILLTAAVITLLGGTLISYYFTHLFQVPLAFAQDSRIMFFLITLAIVISVPNTIYWSILYAKQRFDLINVSTSTGLILRVVLIFVLFSVLPKKYVNLSMYGVIYLLMKCSQNYFVYFWHKQVLPNLPLDLQHFRKKRAREILSFGAHTSLNSVSHLLYNNTANILINVFFGPAFNSIYEVSQKIPNLMKNLFMRATWTLTPTFTDLVARNDRRRFEILFLLYSKLVGIITLPICFSLIFLAAPVIRLWVGEGFDLAGDLLPIHLIPLFVSIPMAASGCVVNAYARVKIPSRITLAAAVVNVLLAVVLTKVFHLGLWGFAIAAAVANFAVSSLFLPYYACKTARVSLRKYWLESFLKPLGIVIMIKGFSFSLISFLQKGFAFSPVVFAVLTPAFILFYAISYFFLLTEGERNYISEFISGRFLKKA